MEKVWTDAAWADYLWWQQADPKVLARLNELIRDSERDPFHGIGKPEPLRGNRKGYWSRRITSEHRLVYCVTDGQMRIVSCRNHYDN
jgi:toxin YoeB